MKISVVIPTYNRAHTLPRALDSVFNQRFKPAEVLVVDDGSDDGTRELINIHYPQCRYLYQDNLGVSSARNQGIQAASGDWIALLDSDDAWHPDKLERQTEALLQSPGHRLCHTEEIWMRKGVRVNAMNKHRKGGGNIFRQCLPLCVISPSAAVLHRSLLDDVGLFDTTLPACEDYDLWLRICAQEPVLYLAQALTIKYGGHADQLSQKHWGMDRFRIQALEKIINTETLNADDQSAAIDMLLHKSRIMAKGAEKRGKWHRATQYRNLYSHYRAKRPAN